MCASTKSLQPLNTETNFEPCQLTPCQSISHPCSCSVNKGIDSCTGISLDTVEAPFHSWEFGHIWYVFHFELVCFGFTQHNGWIQTFPATRTVSTQFELTKSGIGLELQTLEKKMTYGKKTSYWENLIQQSGISFSIVDLINSICTDEIWWTQTPTENKPLRI